MGVQFLLCFEFFFFFFFRGRKENAEKSEALTKTSISRALRSKMTREVPSSKTGSPAKVGPA